jgi:hypothetical protein
MSGEGEREGERRGEGDSRKVQVQRGAQVAEKLMSGGAYSRGREEGRKMEARVHGGACEKET